MTPDHVSVFEPFRDLLEEHEDRLTRAALIVLKLVPLARASFLRSVGEDLWALPGPLQVRTQRITLCEHDSAQASESTEDPRLTSVFLTPDDPRILSREEVRERETGGQRLDGVLEFGDELIVVLESKLDEHVPDRQACYLDIGGSVRKTRTEHVAWHHLLEAWQQLSEADVLSPAEHEVLGDFWRYVEERPRWENLLPFTTLAKAEDNRHRRLRRLRKVLGDATGLEAAREGDRVRVSFSALDPPARRASVAALKIVGEDGREELALSLWPGFKTHEARALFERPALAEDVCELLESDRARGDPTWEFGPIVSVGLVRSRYDLGPDSGLSCREYLASWQDNVDKLGATPTTELGGSVLRWLRESRLALPEDEETIRDVCQRAQSSTPFLVAGFWLDCRWDYSRAVSLDDSGDLVGDVKRHLDQALRALGDGSSTDGE